MSHELSVKSNHFKHLQYGSNHLRFGLSHTMSTLNRLKGCGMFSFVLKMAYRRSFAAYSKMYQLSSQTLSPKINIQGQIINKSICCSGVDKQNKLYYLRI